MINHHGFRLRSRTTQLRLTDLPLVEMFQFGSPNAVPAQARLGLTFESSDLTSAGYDASVGSESNGAFL